MGEERRQALERILERKRLLEQMFGGEDVPVLRISNRAKPRSYQLQGLGTLWGGYVTQGEAEQLCIMPPCSGKTAVAFALVDKCTSRGAMTLFVVNSREELEHLVATHEEHDVLCEVPHLVLSGAADVAAMLSRGGDARVFYATRQLLTKYMDALDGAEVDFLVVDGVHSVLTDTGEDLLKALNRKAALYLDNHLAKLPSSCTPYLSVHVTHRELIQRHGFPSYTLKTIQPREGRTAEAEALGVESLVVTVLLDLVEDLAARCGQGIVFFDTVEACEKCAGLFKARSSRPIVITHSRQPKARENASRVAFAEGKAVLLFAVRMALAGVTFPAATDVVLLTESCSPLELTRMVGRASYPFPNKTIVTIWDCTNILSRVPASDRRQRASLSEHFAVSEEPEREGTVHTFSSERERPKEVALEFSASSSKPQRYRVTTTRALETRDVELTYLRDKHVCARMITLFREKVFGVGAFEFLLNNDRYRQSSFKVGVRFGRSKVLYYLSFGQVIDIVSRFFDVDVVLREVLDQELKAVLARDPQRAKGVPRYEVSFVAERLDVPPDRSSVFEAQSPQLENSEADAGSPSEQALKREIEDVAALGPLRRSEAFRVHLEAGASLGALQELVATNLGRLLKVQWWTRQTTEALDLSWRCDLRLMTIAGDLNVNDVGVYNKPRNAEDAIALAAKQALVYLGVYTSPKPTRRGRGVHEPDSEQGEHEAFLWRHADIVRQLMERYERTTAVFREHHTLRGRVIARLKTRAGDRASSAPRTSACLSELDASFALLRALGWVPEGLLSERARLSPVETVLDTSARDPEGSLQHARASLHAAACLGRLRLSKLRSEFFAPGEDAVVGLYLTSWEAWVEGAWMCVHAVNDNNPNANEEAAQVALYDQVCTFHPQALRLDYRVCFEAPSADLHRDATLDHLESMITSRTFVFKHQAQWGGLCVMALETIDPVTAEPLQIARACWSPDQQAAAKGCGADLFDAIIRHHASQG